MKLNNAMDKEEVFLVRSIIQQEQSHFQWSKQGLCIFLLISLIMLNLMMGSSTMKSIAGIEKCSPFYWII